MTEKLQVPERVQKLGSLMRAGLNRRDGNLPTSRVSRFSAPTFVDQARDYLHLLSSHLGSLKPSFEALMIDIIENPEVSDLTLTRRTQAFLDDLADWHQAAMEIQNLNADGLDREGASLLLSVYRHYLDQVDEWLQRLVDSIENPDKVLQSRGAVWDDQTDRTLDLEVNLSLTQPPDLPGLDRWLAQRAGQEQAAAQKKLQRKVGVLAFILGIFWMS